MTYTIKFKDNDQDNLNFIPFTVGDEMPGFLDYEEVFEFSIRQGYIQNESEIKTLVDGSDHVRAYFTPLTAEDDFWATLGGYENVEYDSQITEYEIQGED